MAESQNEERKAWYNAFRNFRHGILAGIDTAFIAKVVKYNKAEHTADLLPLAKASNGMLSAQFLDCPVAENCYIVDEIIDRLKPEISKVDSHVGSSVGGKLPSQNLMRPGVPVVAVVLDRDNDNWKGGRSTNTYIPNSARLHDANDAIVVGVLGGDAQHG